MLTTNNLVLKALFTSFFLTAFSFCTYATDTTNTSRQINPTNTTIPLVAIANYGSHSSLNAAIDGIKYELAQQGFIADQTVKYITKDVNFDTALIPQMLASLKAHNPTVIVTMATPIAQFAKNTVKDIPIIYNTITDPVAAGLLKSASNADGNVTGSSDQQDLRAMLKFVKNILPQATKIGLLFATAESNDLALVKMMEQAALAEKMQLLSVPINQARDVPMCMQSLRDKIDFIYVGTSGTIQPTLPAIAAEADKMHIPIVNVDEGAVKDKLVLASFGVDYTKVGINAGKLIAKVLRGDNIAKISPIYPNTTDHRGFINMQRANIIGIKIPDNLNVTQVP